MKVTKFSKSVNETLDVSKSYDIEEAFSMMMNFKRKHTGSADYDVKVHLTDQIKNAEKYYKRLISDKETMKQIDLSTTQMSELTGRLFIDEDMLDSQQVTCIKKEIDKPIIRA